MEGSSIPSAEELGHTLDQGHEKAQDAAAIDDGPVKQQCGRLCVPLRFQQERDEKCIAKILGNVYNFHLFWCRDQSGTDWCDQ